MLKKKNEMIEEMDMKYISKETTLKVIEEVRNMDGDSPVYFRSSDIDIDANNRQIGMILSRLEDIGFVEGWATNSVSTLWVRK